MRTLIVYFSKFGNTRKLAEAMAETMRQAGDVRVIAIDQLAASDFEGVDLVVMGSPTHGFTVPQAVRTVLEALPLAILSGKSVAAFDTTVKLWPLQTSAGFARIARPPGPAGRPTHRQAGDLLRPDEEPAEDRRDRPAARRRIRTSPPVGR